MPNIQLRHRKKRNSALAYEMLVRRVALTMVDKDPDSYLEAIDVVGRYFSKGQPLAEEREAFEVISGSRGVSEQSARMVLGEVKKHVVSMDIRLVEIKKSNLIKEVHAKFGQDFFDVHRIPDYRFYATVQMLIDQYRRQSNLSENVERMHLEESLVKLMMTPQHEKKISNRGERVDGLVAALAVKKFEQRYSGSLNEEQKRTLRKFMSFSITGDSSVFEKEMQRERKHLLERLRDARSMQCFSEDVVMGSKMDKATDALGELADVTSENSVQEILLYQRLVAEIESDEK